MALLIAAAVLGGWLNSVEGTAPSFAKGPYLQNVTESTIVICWESDVPSDGTVEYWVEGSPNSSIVAVDSAQRHEVLLESLQPGTRYGYRVRIPVEGEGSFFSARFRTAPAEDSPFSFIVYGDSRGNSMEVYNPRHATLVEAMRPLDPAFIVHTGDFVWRGDSDDCWNAFWEIVAPPDGSESLAGNSPFYPVLGNHEYRVGVGGSIEQAIERFQSDFVLPPNGLEGDHPEWSERFYSFRYGPAMFVAVDANRDMVGTEAPDVVPESPQYEWLIAKLKAARADCPFTFVYLHPSMYSSGPWGSGTGSVLRFLDPLFREGGVDAVFSSHDHFYERCETYMDGYRLLYLVEGAGGASLYQKASGWDEPGSWMWDEQNQTYYTKAFDNSSYSFIKVDLVPLGGGAWRATFSAIRDDGEVFDVVSIRRPWYRMELDDAWTLSFESSQGRTYQAEYSEDVTKGGTTWQPLGDTIQATGPFLTVTDDGSVTGLPVTDEAVRGRFYRVREVP